MNSKAKIALLSIISNISLTALKLLVGFFSGSVSLISEGFHSFGDLLASFIAFYSVKESDKPADDEHQFGHGKFEDLAGFIEASLIILSALFILHIGFKKIITKNIAHTFNCDIAIYVILFSVVVNFIVARLLLKKGKETNSTALLGDGYHLMADVYSSLGIFAGLYIVKLTGHYILDPVIAIIVGFAVLKTGCTLIKKTSLSLLDTSLPAENLKTINQTLEEYKIKNSLKIKNIKTSKSGNTKNIILIICLPPDITLKSAHTLCDEIESRLEKELKNTNIVIHPEPDNTPCLQKV